MRRIEAGIDRLDDHRDFRAAFPDALQQFFIDFCGLADSLIGVQDVVRADQQDDLGRAGEEERTVDPVDQVADRIARDAAVDCENVRILLFKIAEIGDRIAEEDDRIAEKIGVFMFE